MNSSTEVYNSHVIFVHQSKTRYVIVYKMFDRCDRFWKVYIIYFSIPQQILIRLLGWKLANSEVL